MKSPNTVESPEQTQSRLNERLTRLTHCISRVQTAFIESKRDSDLLTESLEDLLAISQSEFGFIGEVWQCPTTEQPILKFLALSNIAWSDETRALYQKQLDKQLEFRNLDTLFGFSLRTGETVISNDPANHHAARGLPKGHPPLNNYLGIPIYYQGELLSMVALANKPEAFSSEDVKFLEPLLNTLGQLIYVSRIRDQQEQAKSQMQNVLAAANAATWSLNTATERLIVNERWAGMLGYKLQEIEPVTISWMRNNMHPEDLQVSRTAMFKHFAGASPFYECVFRFRHKRGHWVWVHGRGQVMSGNETDGRIMYGINMDITEQRELQKQFEKVAALVPGVVMTMMLDEHNRFHIPYLSPSITRLIDIDPADIQSDAKSLLKHVHSEDFKELTQTAIDSIALKEGWRSRFRIHDPKSPTDVRWLEIQATPDIDEDESALWYAYMYDVSDAVLAEHKMQQAREQAEQAASVKAAFLANMSHEIRTPMNGVIGMLDVLAESNTDHKLDENICIMRDSAYSLLTIIDDILDFSKLEAGKLKISPEPVNFKLIVEQVFEMLDRMAIKQGVSLYLFIDPALDSTLLVDAVRLRQIIVNLIGNAIKFSQGTSRPPQVFAEFRLLRIQGDTCITTCKISDNGIGISPEHINKLFSPFVQADDSTSRQFGGTGLGLAITQQLLKQMGGVITADSVLDKGSVFSVTLPLTQVAIERKVQRLDGYSVNLLWDPQAPWLEYIEEYLVSEGANVERIGAPTQLAHNTCLIADNQHFVRVCGLIGVEQYKPVILIERGNRNQLRTPTAGVVTCDVNCLKRDSLVDAVKKAISGEIVPIVKARPLPHNVIKLPAVATSTSPHKISKSILVAEDNSTNQKVIRNLLERLGYTVSLAENGEQAFDLARKLSPDLILSDLHMPVKDGYEFIQAWRAFESQNDTKKIPVIALTANVGNAERQRCKQVGFDHYLVKPLPFQELKETLEQWLKAPEIESTTANRLEAQTVSNTLIIDTQNLEEMLGTDAIDDVLRDYHDCLQSDQPALQKSIREHDYQQVAYIAHKLKSSSRFVGAFVLGDALSDLERAAKAAKGDLSEVGKQALDKLSSTLIELDNLLS